MSAEPTVLSGHGAFRVTLQDGGVVKFECWDMDDDGNVKAYWSAGHDGKSENPPPSSA